MRSFLLLAFLLTVTSVSVSAPAATWYVEELLFEMFAIAFRLLLLVPLVAIILRIAVKLIVKFDAPFG